MSAKPVDKSTHRLIPNTYLPTDQSLTSQNGVYVAEIVSNSYVAVRQKKPPTGSDGLIWISKPAELLMGALHGGKSLVLLLQPDGNLALIIITADGVAGKILWQPNTRGKKASSLVLQDDGKLVLKSGSEVIWTANPNFPAAQGAKPSTLAVGQYLSAGQPLISPNGKFTFTLTPSANLAITNERGATTYYYTGVGGRAAKFLTPFRDGHAAVEVLDERGRQVWRTPENGAAPVHGGDAVLVMRNDGAAAAELTQWKGEGWSTHDLASGAAAVATDRLLLGQTWTSGKPLVSPSGEHWLSLEANGSITLWRGGHKRWTSKTSADAVGGSGAVSASLQNTGLLAVFGPDKKLAWSLGKPAGRAVENVALEVKDETVGTLVITTNGVETWSSKTVAEIPN